MLNINMGHNKEIPDKCQALWQYADYVAKVKEYSKSMSIKEGGRKEGQAIVTQLVSVLLEDNRIQDLNRITTDQDYRNQLYREYGLSE